MKFSVSVNKKEVSLPVSIGYDFRRSHWLVAVRIFVFLFQAVHIYAPKVIDVPSVPPPAEPDRIIPTKGYADQRQKARRNRRRKPKKAMANLYQLG